MSNFLLRLPRWTFSTIVLLAILWLTLAPDPLPDDLEIPLFEGVDKVIHGIMMAGMVGALCIDISLQRSRKGHYRPLRLGLLLLLALGVSVFGGGIELAQSAMAMGRGADWMDFLADAVGAFAAALIGLLIPWPQSLRRSAADQTDREPR